jgi:hypothetical protein
MLAASLSTSAAIARPRVTVRARNNKVRSFCCTPSLFFFSLSRASFALSSKRGVDRINRVTRKRETRACDVMRIWVE